MSSQPQVPHGPHGGVNCQWHIPHTYLSANLVSLRHPDWSVFLTTHRKSHCLHANPPVVCFTQLLSTAGSPLGSWCFFSESHSALIYAYVGICVLDCFYVPLHVFLPVPVSLPSIQFVFGMLIPFTI